MNVKVTCVELAFQERDWVDERDVSHQGADIPLPSCRIGGDQRVGDQLASETYVKEKSHKAGCHTLHQHHLMHAHSHIPRAKFSPLFKRSPGLNLGLTRHSAPVWCFIQYWILFSNPCCGYFVYACACFQKLKCLP